MTPPKVTVVTATVRPEGLPMVADCLRRQSFRDYEWLVCAPAHLGPRIDGPTLGCAVMADPPRRPGDFYRLNGAWNLMASRAQGDLILFVCDWTWFPDDALARVWAHHLEHPNVGLTSVGGQYRSVADGVPTDKWEDDPRLSLCVRPKMFGVGDPIVWRPCEGMLPGFWEQAFAALDRRKLIEVGGFDEDYDRVNANSEKELATRMYVNGYRFDIDATLEIKNYTHERMAPPEELERAWGPSVAMLEGHQWEMLGERPTRLKIEWPYSEAPRE